MKKSTILVFLLSIIPLLVFSANETEQQYSGGYYLGVGSGQMIHAMEGKIIGGYCNDHFLAEIGYSYTKFELDPRFTIAYTTNSLSGKLGLRNRIRETNIFLCYGVAGDYGFLSNEKDNIGLQLQTPFGVGGFIGLDLHVNEHYLLSAKSNFYSYTQTTFKDGVKHQAFGTQSISFSYVF
jgi:hypothetical protein